MKLEPSAIINKSNYKKEVSIMPNINHTNNTNEILLIQVLKATDKELINLYITGTNRFAKREMRQRGLY